MKPVDLLTITALLAPRERRAEWLDEWRSELWYVQKLGARSEWEVLRFCLDAFADAWWVRRVRPADQRWTGSPVFCLTALLIAAAATAIPFTRQVLHAGASVLLGNSRGFVFGEGLILLSAVVVLLSVVPFGQGRFIEKSHLYNRCAQWREGLFLGLRLVLAWSIVFFGTCDAGIYFGAIGIGLIRQ